jgi:hypothetical protein
MTKQLYTDLWIERFWKRVDKSAGPDGCWPWIGHRNRYNYGLCSNRSQRLLAHRAAWEIANGRPMGDMCGLHSCDNPPCVNPAHIRPGTMTDNNRDMLERGRVRRGEAHAYAKLTETEVQMVRTLCRAGFKQRDIARTFGVSQTAVSNALNGQSWAHVKDPA